MINILLDSSRNMKRTVALCYDLLAIPAAIYLAISLRYGYMPPPIDNGVIIATLFFTILASDCILRSAEKWLPELDLNQRPMD